MRWPTPSSAQSARPPRCWKSIRLRAVHATKSRPGLRSVLASPYVIFYRVNGDIAELVRILDGRRDIDEIFSDGSQQD